MRINLIGLLINIGSNSTSPNGRGRIFEDYAFEYLPIPECKETTQNVATYRQLGFSHVKHPDLPVHLDPSFETFTYGHIRRGFGDIRALLKLTENDVLFFFATLERKEGWSTYIIGYFRCPRVHDCRRLSAKEILGFRFKGFADNAHLRRLDPSVDLLIKGGTTSRLLDKAFPLTEAENHLELRKSLRDTICTLTGKGIQHGTPWFRWVLRCEDPIQLLDMISCMRPF